MLTRLEDKHKKLLFVVGGICLLLLVVLVIVNAKRLQATFDPDAFARNDKKNENSVDYDSSVFGADEDGNDGLEMDDTSKEDYNLKNGNQSILNKKNKNSQGLHVSTGSGDGTGTGNAVTPNNQGGITVNGEGTGQGGEENGGTTGNTGSDNNPGTGDSTETGSTSHPGTEDDNTPNDEKDSDEGKYGTDYNAPEKVDTYTPETGYVLSSIEVTGDLKEHFYEEEAPRIEEMRDYITVTGIFKKGNTTKKQVLSYRANDETGGDYTVSWDKTAWKDKKSHTNSIGYPQVGNQVGSSYTATISYEVAGVTKTVKVAYDIVTWKLKLNDFTEKEAGQLDEEYQSFQSYADCDTFSPKDSPQIDLTDAVNQMRTLVAIRTKADKNYHNVNVQMETELEIALPVYSTYFGGWKEKNGDVTGNTYQMKRPTDEQIDENHVYEVTLDPKMITSEKDSEYVICLSGSIDSKRWDSYLMAYNGDSTTLDVPEGVDAISLPYMASAKKDASYSNITKINLPASVSNLVFGSGGVNYPSIFQNVEEVTVDEDNLNYLDIDGVVYNKTGKTLILVPAAKKSMNKWSKYVNTVNTDAWQHVSMEEVTLPDTVITLKKMAFYNADIKKLTCSTKEQMNWEGELIFANSAPGNDTYCGIKTLCMESEEPPTAEKDSIAFAQTYSDDVRGKINIVVPDSSNHQVYLSYLKMLTKHMDTNTKISGEAFQILKTSKNAQNSYNFVDGFLTKKTDATYLVMVSPTLADTVEVPDQIETIGNEAFTQCDSIVDIILTSKIKTIGDNAFAQMENLSSIAMKAKQPPTIGNYVFGDSVGSAVRIYVTAGDIYDQYKTTYTKSWDDVEYSKGTTARILKGLSGLEDLIIKDGSYYREISDGQYELVQLQTSKKGVVSVMEGTVSLASNCLDGCTNVQGLILPKTVTKIADDAFAGTTKLECMIYNGSAMPSLEGSGVNEKDIHIFASDTSAYHMDYENSFQAGVYMTNADDTKTFVYGLSSITGNYSLLDNTTKIAERAFQDNEAIEGISNGTKVVSFGDYAFDGCKKLRGIVSLNVYREEEITFGKYTFRNCESLQSLLMIPEKDNELKLTVAFPKGETSIPEGCFYQCKSLYGANMNKIGSTETSAVTSIGKEAFYGCSNMVVYNSSENLESIGASAFEGCESLTGTTINYGEDTGTYLSVYLPSTVKSVGKSCFKGCKSIQYVLAFCDTISEEMFYECTSLKLCYDGRAKSLGDRAFYGCTSYEGWNVNTGEEIIQALYLYPVLESIGEECFKGCTGLTAGYMWSDACTELSDGIFEDCTNLKSLSWSTTMAANLTKIGNRAFKNCTRFASDFEWYNSKDNTAYFNKLTSVGDQAYYNCDSITTFHNSYRQKLLESIGDEAFYDCDGLETVTIRWNLNSGIQDSKYKTGVAIGEKAFMDCSNLTSVAVNGIVDDFGVSCFENCDHMKTFTYLNATARNGLTKINPRTFYNCAALTEIIIGVKITEIGDYAFYNCREASKVTPYTSSNRSSLEVVGDYAFAECEKIPRLCFWERVINEETGELMFPVKTIGDYAFLNCKMLGTVQMNGKDLGRVELPSTVTSVGTGCFNGCTNVLQIIWNGEDIRSQFE